jgi:hypothetical protein
MSAGQSTLREIIRRRIYQEVSEYNAKKRSQLPGLMPRTLPGQSPADNTTPLDWQAHYDQTITAFQKRHYIVIIDDRQVTDLDASISLSAQSTVTFLKLIPLIGG